MYFKFIISVQNYIKKQINNILTHIKIYNKVKMMEQQQMRENQVNQKQQYEGNQDSESQNQHYQQQVYELQSEQHQFNRVNSTQETERNFRTKEEKEQKILKNESKQKQKQTNDEEELLSTNDEQLAGFNIIGEDSTNQILQINLYPKEQIFIRGKILYANFNYKDKSQFVGYQSFPEFIREFIHSGFHPLHKIHNTKNHIVYAGISKAGGKILSIDNEVYGNDLFVNPARVILSNVNHQNSTIKKHPNLKKLQNRLRDHKKNEQPRTLVVLQSSNNNVIVEKYLGLKEKLYVKERLILGLSGTVKAEPSFGGFGTAKLQGPGWVFMENDSNSWIRENKLLILFFVTTIIWLFTAIFQQNQ